MTTLAIKRVGSMTPYKRFVAYLTIPVDSVAITNAKLLGALVKVLPPATATPLIKYVGSSLSSPLFFRS